MKHFLISIFSLCLASASAQKITVDLPHFAGKEYMWFMCIGEKRDTAAHGVLDAKGQIVLTVPPAYKNWQGMTNFILTEGGGLEIILNGEKNFSVSCTVATPTINDIHYSGSAENTFLLEQNKQQQHLLKKTRAIAAAVWEYTPQDSFYKVLSDEKEALEKRYVALQKQIAESPLYAARIRQILNFCTGIGSRIDLTEEQLIAEYRHYVREVLDFGQLRNSGLWKNFFTQWVNLEATQSDNILLEDSKAMLARVHDKELHGILLKKITSIFHQYGKEGLLTELGVEDLLSPGNQAPKLYLPDNTSFVPLNSLLFFYESGCGNCENELLQLSRNYAFLQGKNIEIISIAADTDEQIFRENSSVFPWQQKLCDYKGFTGVNFKNYAIIGTPTIFIIDSKGVITGRYARMADVKF